MKRHLAVFLCVIFGGLIGASPLQALPFGDINGDGSVNVIDVQLMIGLSLGIPLSPVLDADGDGIPDAYAANTDQATCGTNTVKDGPQCTVDQDWLDDALAAAFDDGYQTCVDQNPCQPNCCDKECGNDGCGGSCGTCPSNAVCTQGTCVCVPDCSADACGSDGCGGTCGGVVDDCGVCNGANACAGCDGVANSGKVFDQCGVCNGDNSTCTGCLDANACNYDGTAIVGNNALCTYPTSSFVDCAGNCVVALDCAGTCGGTLVDDACGVCNGDNSTCTGCLDANACNYDGTAIVGNNALCTYPASSFVDCAGNCVVALDCAGTCGGTLVDDACGVCNGDDSSCTGCMDTDACNYDSDATIADTTSCTYPASSIVDCDGDCLVAIDCAGECGGTAVADCAGTCNGSAVLDICGVCDGPGYPNGACNCAGDFLDCAGECGGGAVADCAGTCNGSATLDVCGQCGGSGIPSGACNCAGDVLDCAGNCGGGAVYDACGDCNGNNSCVDCAGTPYGSASYDSCGVCNGSNSCVDCAGTPYGGASVDSCGVCNGSNSCVDCAGTPYGGASVDVCGVCDGPGIAAGACNCAGDTLDCAGDCGGSKSLDACGVCDGDNSSCTGCMDTSACTYNAFATINNPSACTYPASSLFDCQGNCIAGFDDCGECGGDNSCIVDCTATGYDANLDYCPPLNTQYDGYVDEAYEDDMYCQTATDTAVCTAVPGSSDCFYWEFDSCDFCCWAGECHDQNSYPWSLGSGGCLF